MAEPAATKRFVRGLTIEYVIVLMTIIAAFAGAMLTIAGLSGDSAKEYTEYTERKRYLDAVGTAYIGNRCGTGEDVPLSAIPGGEAYGYSIEEYADTLYVRRGNTPDLVDLYVKLADADGDGTLEPVAYVYGML